MDKFDFGGGVALFGYIAASRPNFASSIHSTDNPASMDYPIYGFGGNLDYRGNIPRRSDLDAYAQRKRS